MHQRRSTAAVAAAAVPPDRGYMEERHDNGAANSKNNNKNNNDNHNFATRRKRFNPFGCLCSRDSLLLIVSFLSVIALTVGVVCLLIMLNGRDRDEADFARAPGPSSFQQKRPAGAMQPGRLQCEPHGHRAAFLEDWVYWNDLSSYQSHNLPVWSSGDDKDEQKIILSKRENPCLRIRRLHSGNNDAEERYLTFDLGGGFNNIRMGLETALALACASGRTVVLPPRRSIYLMQDAPTNWNVDDFFPLHELSLQRHGIRIISMEEFLQRVGLAGKLRNKFNSRVEYPPDNSTDWNDVSQLRPMFTYLRRTGTYQDEWEVESSILVVPKEEEEEKKDKKETLAFRLHQKLQSTVRGYKGAPPPESSSYAPPPDDVWQRFSHVAKSLTKRKSQEVRHVFSAHDRAFAQPLMLHYSLVFANFYTHVFWQDEEDDLWMKTIIRDVVRYRDPLHCAAVASAPKTDDDNYHAFHIRRGDFAYKNTRLSATQLDAASRPELQTWIALHGAPPTPRPSIYVATDETSEEFFQPLHENYQLSFLSSATLSDSLQNPSYFGMVDQLVAASTRGIFFGTFQSTFTSFIVRMRGYHAQRRRRPPPQQQQQRQDQSASLFLTETDPPNTYYFAPMDVKYDMAIINNEIPIRTYWSREYAMAWKGLV